MVGCDSCISTVERLDKITRLVTVLRNQAMVDTIKGDYSWYIHSGTSQITTNN